MEPIQLATNTGAFFNVVVSAILAGASFAFSFYLLRLWSGLSATMRAYGVFWFTTGAIWSLSVVRYGAMSLRVSMSDLLLIDQVLQLIVFTCGPILFFLVGRLYFHSTGVAALLALVSSVLGALSWITLLGTDGITYVISEVDIKSVLNPAAQALFGVQVAVIVFLLLIHAIARSRHKTEGEESHHGYPTLASLVLVVYLVLAGIDNSSFATDWSLIVLRMLYAGGILFGYLVMAQYQARLESYLIRRSTPEDAAQP